MPRSEGGAGRAARSSSAPSRSASSGPTSPFAGPAFALLRIFVGLMFLTSGFEKIRAGWLVGHQMTTTAQRINAAVRETDLSSFGHFLTQTVIPHSALFIYLVVFGEILVGLLLTFGLLSRFAALYALGLNLAYLAGYWYFGPPWQMLNEAFLMLEVAFLMVGPGRTFGLDAQLARKRPGWILW